MEEMPPTVAVPFRVGNSVCENPTVDTHLDITRLKLMEDTAGLLSDSVTKVSTVGKGLSFCDLDNEVSDTTVAVPEQDKQRGVPLLDMWTSSLCGEEFLGFEATSEIGTPGSVDIGKSICSVDIIANAADLESNVETEVVRDSVSVAVSLEEEIGDGSDPKPYAVVLQLALGKGVRGTVTRSVFEVDYVPLWGVTSICGRRPEMEDAVATVPYFLEIPIQMLIGDRVLDGMSKYITHQAAHFFGVYDGHGGSQMNVLNEFGALLRLQILCDHVHSTLAEEIEYVKNGLCDGSTKDSCQEQWKKTFTNCFLKPNREDEYARIEAAGGKVIQWNGHRVFGVLAMSRSIGFSYLQVTVLFRNEMTFNLHGLALRDNNSAFHLESLR
ncbi:hypothetical protein GH714_029899 [Hevea brasiliensis]|uniref:protein-serine/threonine phosphatase n=1 Tax=Hevea brasiliensis TaxID=3981 RepID=A0A6A6LS79_HEVBR|nr:hypothetical protein GH714_029899 [Hevea brasiliensis]